MHPATSAFRARPLKFGGRPYLLRSLVPEDEDRLLAFFQSHTPETIEDRYGFQMASMTREKAASLVNVDPKDGLALGIFERSAEGEILHAVGRYCASPDGTSAELALVVRETLRRLGMGRALLRNLVRAARNRGLRKLWAQVRGGNVAMRNLFMRHGFAVQDDNLVEEGAVKFHMLLDNSCGARRRRRT